jgi:hypothetical protein
MALEKYITKQMLHLCAMGQKQNRLSSLIAVNQRILTRTSRFYRHQWETLYILNSTYRSSVLPVVPLGDVLVNDAQWSGA